jgi:hypothetical protein
MSSARTEPARRSALPLLVPLIAAASGGCINGPLRTQRAAIDRSQTGDDTTTNASALTELSVHDRLGPDLEYRVDGQFVAGRSERDAPGIHTEDETVQIRPSGELILSSDTLRWSQRAERQQTHSLLDAGPDNTLVRTDLLEKFEWLPPGLPQLTGWIDYRTVEDDLYTARDTVETQLSAQQVLPALDYQATLLTRTDTDRLSDVENQRVEHTLRATWRDEFADDKLQLTISGYDNQRTTDLEGSAGSTPGVEVFPSQALAAVDTTPEIATLPLFGALIDGNENAPTGIDIGGFGSGGEEDWNMAVRLPPGASIDTLQITTVDEVPSQFVNQFAFTVWASNDNTFWTQVGTPSFDYDPILKRFRMTFPEVDDEYVKVVNTSSPAGAPKVLVSELHVFRSAADSASTLTTNDATRNGNGSLSYRVNDRLTLGYDFFVQQADTETEGVEQRDETRYDQGVWASFRPLDKVDANVRYATQHTRDPIVQDEDSSTLTGVLAYRPIDALDINASYTNTSRQVDGADDLETEALQTLTSARLLDTLRADLTLQRSTQDDVTNQRQIDHWVYGTTLTATLTPTLELVLGHRRDDATVSGPGAAELPDPSEQRSEMIWIYKPNERLTAQLELDYVDTFAGAGLDHRARLDWIPFADGKVNVALDYDRSAVESSGSSQLDRYRAQLRYTISPRAFFEFNASAIDPAGEETTEFVGLAFNFSG